ncbi:dynein regulatory complex protein 9 [Venturia canescens]|uniref:dynein regulatory complex protein 9 n=1 Tax=Venturia canescens TaxID=32260 RepID=UPI001C9C8A34|nr:dynein regulatory complex protein 9 [Venturia canescens]
MSRHELIYSRNNPVKESQKTEDFSTPATKSCASDPTNRPPCFHRTQREAVVTVLQKFTDLFAIYRSTLDRRISTIRFHDLDDRLDHFETMMKLRDDSLYVSNILDDLIENVESNGRYDVLIREIEDNEREREEEICVVENYEDTMKNLDELGKLLENEKKVNAREREELGTKLASLKNEVKKLRYKANVESKYVKAYEEARCEAHALRCSFDYQTLRDKQNNISSNENNEIRVGTEIVKFLEINILENERAVSEWRERYEQETLTYTSEIQHLSKEIEAKEERLRKLQSQYRERQEFIDTYIAEKERARRLKKREERRRDCAIRIQAWWRGLMVRRKLGPYRPDERKKKRAVKSKK